MRCAFGLLGLAVRTLRDGTVDAIKVHEYKPRDRDGTSPESPLTFQEMGSLLRRLKKLKENTLFAKVM